MEQQPKHRYIDFFYRFSLFVKGASALIEILVGVLTLFVTQDLMLRVATLLTQDELFEDPKDLVSQYILNVAHQFSLGGKKFVILYLLSHGIIRLILVIGLLKKKLEAYYLSFIVFSGFIIYQLYRYSHTRSAWLLGLSIFDLFFLWLIWKEYTYVVARIAERKSLQMAEE